jgi:hypothetical protein
MFSTASIDTGKRNQHFHTFCATGFFVLIMLTLSINYFILLRMKLKNTHVISTSSILVKTLLTGLNYLFLYLTTLESSKPMGAIYGSDIGKIVE